MLALLLVPFIFFLALAVFIYFTYSYRKKRDRLKYLQDFSHLVPEEAFFNILSNESVYFKDIQLNSALCKKLNESIDSLYFVHGTFVGEDPFHLFGLIDSVLPMQLQGLTHKMKGLTKIGQELFTGDNANFTDKHVQKMTQSLKGIQVKSFRWSSGNHHHARIIGAINLAKDLSVRHKKNERVLLLGHSHAAQLFALLTQLMYHEEFIDILEQYFISEVDIDHFKNLKHKLKTLKIDFVTFGSPPRYEWIKSDNIRVMHFINHRLNVPRAGHLSGILTTRDGDYIQQIGLTGSDFVSAVDKENKINKQLDKFFGEGMNRATLKEIYQKKQRLHNIGRHLLVDYGDKGKLPNFATTVFGHGVYTKIDLLDFHLKYIWEEYYKDS